MILQFLDKRSIFYEVKRKEWKVKNIEFRKSWIFYHFILHSLTCYLIKNGRFRFDDFVWHWLTFWSKTYLFWNTLKVLHRSKYSEKWLILFRHAIILSQVRQSMIACLVSLFKQKSFSLLSLLLLRFNLIKAFWKIPAFADSPKS